MRGPAQKTQKQVTVLKENRGGKKEGKEKKKETRSHSKGQQSKQVYTFSKAVPRERSNIFKVQRT